MAITDILMAKGFVYLVAVIDWATRRMFALQASITMDVRFYLDAGEEAISQYGKPAIMNTDKGSQFTNHAETKRLKM